jgi:hypothetical protein
MFVFGFHQILMMQLAMFFINQSSIHPKSQDTATTIVKLTAAFISLTKHQYWILPQKTPPTNFTSKISPISKLLPRH